MNPGGTMYCYRCGNKLPEESLFCNRCGTRVPTTPERVRRTKPSGAPGSVPPEAAISSTTTAKSAKRAELPEEPEEQFEPDDDFGGAEEWDEEEATGMDEDEDEAGDEELIDDEEDQAAELPAPYRSPGEKVIFSINPAFYPVTTGYIISTFSALLLVAVVAFFKLGLWLALGGGVLIFIPSVIRHIRHLHTIFTLTTIKLEISEGLFSKTTRNIPLRHIQDVSVSENFSERLLGIGDIIVDTPAMETTLTLNNVNDPRRYADLILEQLERWT